MKKICCDVCGGPLMVGSGGQSAFCKICGMEHSIERVREILATVTYPDVDAPPPITPAPVEPVIEEPIIEEPIPVEPVREEPIVEETVPVEPVCEEPVTQQPAVDEPVIIAVPVPANPIPMAQYSDAPVTPPTHVFSSVVAPPGEPGFRKRAVYNPDAEVYITSPRLQAMPEAYFESMLVYLFPQFEIYKDVPLDAQYQFDFLFEKNGQPLLAIIFCHANDYQSTNALVVMGYCRRHHIECLRFFTNFANKPDYVRDRINAVRAIRRAK